jgi:hypothetical protein
MPIPKNLDIAAINARRQAVMVRSFLWSTTAPECLNRSFRWRVYSMIPS